MEPVSHSGTDNREIKRVLKIKSSNAEKLRKHFDAVSENIFEKYIDSSEEYLSLMMEEAFCDGFSLGVKLVLQALEEKER